MSVDPYLELVIPLEDPPGDHLPDASRLVAVPAWPRVTEPGTVPVETIAARHAVEATEGARLLDDVETFLSRFVVYPGDAERIAHVLWIGHTWFMDAWESTPRIAFLSPEPGSGKSRALEVTEPLVPRPVHAVNTTPAYLFRKVSDVAGVPTILYDEIDTVFGPKAKDNEDVRGMLNAGHRKGAVAGRCVIRGKIVETEELPAYCAVALAGLDDLPDTIMTRSVVVRMRRRAPGEQVEPWRLRINGPDAQALGDRLLEWSNANAHRLGISWPDMPEGIEDRNADVWEALLAVADLAGGTWPDLARRSAVALVADTRGRTVSLGVTLLRDLRTVFVEARADKLSTETILDALVEMDESPWGDLRGKPLDARGLARRLAKYDVKPKNVRIDGKIPKGYDAADLADSWARYLTPQFSDTPPRYVEVGDDNSAVARQESATAATPLHDLTCSVCLSPMFDLGDGATTHPNCEATS
ncbi:DUF3631 domain-containing protein [Cellulomonas sp. P24]|uniref:DUF3631 domain-containing protein n=1 Tax=Cellulomonas sp. P24 TaxID=2885206 RepID=UPI00216B4434|nr:DUF3631 domain-containing protein [Cellulomonas sp. P24]MCR6494236.1 DUF3631 domain-containing protein [Cellulomonas sp. P24]